MWNQHNKCDTVSQAIGPSPGLYWAKLKLNNCVEMTLRDRNSFTVQTAGQIFQLCQNYVPQRKIAHHSPNLTYFNNLWALEIISVCVLEISHFTT